MIEPLSKQLRLLPYHTSHHNTRISLPFVMLPLVVVPVPFVCSALLCLMDMLLKDDGFELLVFLSRVAKCRGRHLVDPSSVDVLFEERFGMTH